MNPLKKRSNWPSRCLLCKKIPTKHKFRRNNYRSPEWGAVQQFRFLMGSKIVKFFSKNKSIRPIPCNQHKNTVFYWSDYEHIWKWGFIANDNWAINIIKTNTES